MDSNLDAALRTLAAALPPGSSVPVPRDWLLAKLRDDAAPTEAHTLTLRDAARESGYTADHLGRLVRNGTLPNVGRKHSPRVRACDLPRKPAAATFSRSAVARAIASR